MNSTDAGAFAHRFIAAQHALDNDGEAAVDAMLELFGPASTLGNSALKLAGAERRGQEGARSFWSDYCKALHGAETEFHAVTTGDDAVGLFWTTRLSRDGAEATEYDGATWLRLGEDGLIAHLHGYYDTRALASPARP